MIEQKIENDKAELFYKYSIKTIKQIEKYNIWICISVAILYIFAILFEMIFLNIIIENHGFDENLYRNFRTMILAILLIFLPISALLGSKASTALGLKNVFDIKDQQ